MAIICSGKQNIRSKLLLHKRKFHRWNNLLKFASLNKYCKYCMEMQSACLNIVEICFCEISSLFFPHPMVPINFIVSHIYINCDFLLFSQYRFHICITNSRNINIRIKWFILSSIIIVEILSKFRIEFSTFQIDISIIID